MNKTLTASILISLLTLSGPALAQDKLSTTQPKAAPVQQPLSTPAKTAPEQTPNPSAAQPSAGAVVTSININTANAERLALLSGIGPAKAAAIVAYREQHGPFESIDDLAKVSGIGAATVDKNRHLLSK